MALALLYIIPIFLRAKAPVHFESGLCCFMAWGLGSFSQFQIALVALGRDFAGIAGGFDRAVGFVNVAAISKATGGEMRMKVSKEQIEERIAPLNTARSQFVVDATRNMLARCRQIGREPMVYLHDPLAVGAAIAPELLDVETVYVDVETSGDLTLGQVVADRRDAPSKGRLGTPVNCVMRVRAEAFLSLFLSRIFSFPCLQI